MNNVYKSIRRMDINNVISTMDIVAGGINIRFNTKADYYDVHVLVSHINALSGVNIFWDKMADAQVTMK